MKTIKRFYAWGTDGSFHLCQDENGLFLQWGGPQSEYARIRCFTDIAFELANTKITQNQYHFDSFDEAVMELLRVINVQADELIAHAQEVDERSGK